MTDNEISSKPALVLLHGWGVNQGVWQQTISGLGQQCRVITPDLPGFGLAQQYPQPYTLHAVLEQLAAQIPDGSRVCGWSLGGLLAVALAEQYPQKVSRLALVASSPCFLAQADWPGMSHQVMQQFAQALSVNLTQTIERFLAIQSMGSSSARADSKLLKQAILAYPAARPEAVAGALALLSDCDLRQTLANLSQPVTGIFGRLDSLVPVAVVPHLQQLKADAEFTVLPHASHAPFISHPVEFQHWLTDWLSRS